MFWHFSQREVINRTIDILATEYNGDAGILGARSGDGIRCRRIIGTVDDDDDGELGRVIK